MTEKGYVTQSDDSREFSEHHTEQLEVEEPKPKKSPLYFALRINGSYYISFKNGDGNNFNRQDGQFLEELFVGPS